MTPEVEEAVREIREAFPDHQVDVVPEAQGGAYVVVRDLTIGDHYVPPTTWVGFLVDFQYPRSDVYPHFIDGAIRRADGGAHVAGFSGPTDWRGIRTVQISRRSNRWQPAVDTAVTKLLKVQQWIREQ